MKQLKVNKRKRNGKVRMLVGAAALFLFMLGMTVQAAELKRTGWLANKGEWDSRQGYHLGDIAQTKECGHSADDDSVIAVSIKGSELKPNKEYLKDNFHIAGAKSKMSQKYKDQINADKIIWETAKVSGINSSQISNRVAKLKVNGKEIVLAAPYLCPDGYAGYSYFRHYFSYCPDTEEIYYTGTAEHVWLACTHGDLGVNEYHPKAFNHKLYRYYIEPNSYKVLFDKNGGSGAMADQKAKYDSAFSLRTNAYTRKGYTFTGWNTKKDGTGTSYRNKEEVKNLTEKDNGTVTLYAQWKPNTLKIRYHANGGQAKPGYTLRNQIVQESGTELVKEIKYTTKTINLHNVATLLTRSGYSIDGAKAWSVGSIGGEKVSQENGSVPQIFRKMMEEKSGQTVTLYPNWKANAYVIHFDGNGATSGSMKDQKAAYNVAVTLNPNEYKRTGYTFTGWKDGTGKTYKDKQSVKNLTEKNNGTVTLYAQWEVNTLKIRYHANGGQAKPGYTLNNQIVEKDGAVLVKEITYKDTSLNLHNVGALLTRSGYNIDAAKAWSVGSITGETVSQEEIAVPQVFKKMMEEKSGQIVTLYPNWKANSYLIHFDGNGATEGNMEDITVNFDQEVTLPENLFTRTTDQGESVFLGWNRNQEVHEAEFLNQGAVKNLAEEDGAVVTLYAIWDDCPQIEAVDRYFSLDFARAGKITEEELLSTASATDREDINLENRTSAQIAEKGLNGSLGLYGYAAIDFTGMTDSGSVSMTYKAVDSVGNTVYETVTVFITNTDPLVRTDFKYTRFINEKYSTASYEAGGLHPESVWRKNPEYRSELQKALTNLKSDTPEIKYHFTHEEIVQAQKLYKK